jgi:Putative Ig domain
LPKGLTLNSASGVISGPVSSQAVTETFTVTLTSANGASTTKQFTISVCGALAIITDSLPSATGGQNYSATLQGTGGTTPYTWAISAGVLPKGLTLNSASGVISGPVSSQAVTETFTVTLTSANGASTTKQFTITVCGALEITTSSLPMGTSGQNYSQTLQGSGGTTPYSWSISAGVLPKGLTLNSATGVINGAIGSGATTETFTVTLTGANGAIATKQFTISLCRSW